MRKIFLSVVGFSMICRLNAHAQVKQDSVSNKPAFSLYNTPDQDSTQYNPRKLRLDEVDFVSSYYSQNGDHSAVTGGIGTEKVTDFANSINLNFVWTNQHQNKNTLAVGLGFDAHTAASQAFVSKTGASSPNGTRLYPSLDWTVENAKTGNTFGVGTYYSSEYNYQSLGADLHFSVKTDNKDGEFSAKLQGYFDHVKLIYPSEFIPVSTTTTTTTSASSSGSGGGGKASIPSSPRETYSAAFGYTQIINSRLQIAFLADVVGQNGYLSLPFHRVYFTTGKDTIEKLPSSRFKLPLGFRLNYFLGDNIILRSYYRYYLDNWGIRSNTANLEIAYKVSPFFSISPFYRYYNQSAARYFAPYEQHSPTDQYYTSNYEYAKFSSQFFGVGFRIAPPKGVFGWQGLHELEIRYGHYTQTTDLVSDVVSLSLGFK
ncbi:DUF3570 domain-containing protein [Mucilaginibacter sp. X5P1]|uniref:DUF3570 domain-containing protein n=1 Tax=Mucilaginibacter sp. X5P1 TaxID=2723088 RepID=UPI0016214914|nr:DUF3570 domain-containing protein [Mucilaginibacter sp. X5P1]MBB6138599.1 hypothetical protein [Mucilaginibacter sp. X5P1]